MLPLRRRCRLNQVRRVHPPAHQQTVSSLRRPQNLRSLRRGQRSVAAAVRRPDRPWLDLFGGRAWAGPAGWLISFRGETLPGRGTLTLPTTCGRQATSFLRGGSGGAAQRGPSRNGSAVVDHEFFCLAPGPGSCPAVSLRRDGRLAPGRDVQAKDALPVAASAGPLVSKNRQPGFGRADGSRDLAWSVTLTGTVVRLFVVSRLSLSGLPLVARG